MAICPKCSFEKCVQDGIVNGSNVTVVHLALLDIPFSIAEKVLMLNGRLLSFTLKDWGCFP